MKHKLFLTMIVSTTMLASCTKQTAATGQDAALEAKVEETLSRLTTEEKVGQMTMWEYFFSNTPAGVCMQLDVGWSVTAGTDPCSWFKRFPRRSPSLHAKEVFARGAPGIVGQPGKLPDGTPRKGVDWDKLFVTTDLDGVKWYVVECETNPASLLSITESFAFLHQKGRC